MVPGDGAQILCMDEASIGNIHKESMGPEAVRPQEGALQVGRHELCCGGLSSKTEGPRRHTESQDGGAIGSPEHGHWLEVGEGLMQGSRGMMETSAGVDEIGTSRPKIDHFQQVGLGQLHCIY